ncbi:toll/interleukin-1 receptor domain-containing protein [Amycolatopsis sp. NPDC051716]|uniref:tetratricopeptide repeat protein n=1 Tax=Amycolatopsis sp. NPDC051716 TaxID=3155804 RepID=UPI00342CFDDE
MFDVFLCYSWSDDKSWTDDLHAELNALGIAVFQDDKDIPFGDTLAPALQAALGGSRMLVPLIGPAFHESPSCRQELLYALTASYRLDPKTIERVMPVTWRVPPSKLRPRQLKHPKLLSREAYDVAAQARIIADKLERLRASDGRRFGDAPPLPRPRWYPDELPTNRRFHGRGEVMWDLHEALLARDKPRNLGHAVVSVTGGGGQGKSALCEQYARWFAADHPGGVFVIRLGGSDRRRRPDPRAVLSRYSLQLGQLAKSLNLPVEDDLGAARAAIARSLDERPPYLWIVDDVPSDIDESYLHKLYAPTVNGKTLINTRGSLAGLVSAEIALEPLERNACLGVLTNDHAVSEAKSPEREAALGIVNDLGQNPLGLTVAAGLTTLPDFEGYPKLRAELQQDAPDALELAEHLAGELPVGAAKGFGAVMVRSFAQLTDPGREVLAASSVLGAAPIPAGLTARMIERMGTTSAEAGLERLVARGLAEDLGNGSYTVHALVSRAARFRFPAGYRRKLRDHACDLLGRQFEAGREDFGLVRSAASCLPHVLALATEEWPTGPAEWHLLGEAGRAQFELGDNVGALESLETLNERAGRSAEFDEETRVRVLANIAGAQYGTAEFSAALRGQREVIERLNALPDVDESYRLQTEENLSNTLSALGEFEQARELITSVYRRRRDSAGLTRKATLIALNNLVIAVGRCGRPALALRLGIGAWSLWHRGAGPDEPETLDSVENIANNLLRLGHVAEAAATNSYLVSRRAVVLGPEHPSTIDSQENLATATGASYWPVYAARLRAQGPSHPDTIATLEHLLRSSLPSGAVADPVDHVVSGLPADVRLENVRLDGEHAESLSELISSAVQFEEGESGYGPEHPRALRAKLLLVHALAAADQFDGQVESALPIITDSRDGLEEAYARDRSSVQPDELVIARELHHWILRLLAQEPAY